MNIIRRIFRRLKRRVTNRFKRALHLDRLDMWIARDVDLFDQWEAAWAARDVETMDRVNRAIRLNYERYCSEIPKDMRPLLHQRLE